MSSSRSLHLKAVLDSAHLSLSGVPVEGAGVVWEFFAGSAGWTKSLAKRGCAYLTPIEILDCPHLDLLKYLSVEKCILVLRAKLVDAAHFGAPCNSLSTAITPPWRSAEYPFGFPDLVGTAAVKVRVGNALFAVAAQLINVCDDCGVVRCGCDRRKPSHFVAMEASSYYRIVCSCPCFRSPVVLLCFWNALEKAN